MLVVDDDVRNIFALSSVLERRDVMRYEGIPITSPARTLVDLAAVVNEKMLRAAVRRALGLGRISIRHRPLAHAGGTVILFASVARYRRRF